MPLELTQKMELQLLKNSNEARLLLFVTITGLRTASKSPVNAPAQHSFELASPSVISTSRSMMSLASGYDGAVDMPGGPQHQDSIGDKDEKAAYPHLPPNYLQLVAEHFVSFLSLKNIKICHFKVTKKLA